MTLPKQNLGLTGGEAGTPRRGRRPAWLTRTGGDLAEPGRHGLLISPRLPSPCGARLGGGDGVRFRRPGETLGGGHRVSGRARLLIARRGNRHCRQTYLSRARLSTPLGPTV